MWELLFWLDLKVGPCIKLTCFALWEGATVSAAVRHHDSLQVETVNLFLEE